MHMNIEAVAQFADLSCVYNDPLSLLKDYRPESVANMTDDEQEYIRCSFVFEPFCFYVKDGDTVLTVDSLNNDVLVDNSLDSFLRLLLEGAKEQL